MLTDLLAALVEPSPRTKDAVGGDKLAAFRALPATEQLKVLETDLSRLPEDYLGQVVKALGPAIRAPFVPLPGPQTRALNNLADELLYGGQAGGGKSTLLLGTAALHHKRALILRRQATELDGLVAELKTMLGAGGWRSEGSGGTHTISDRVIRLGGCREPDDWNDYAGRARDYLGLDEGAEFLEEQVASLIGWVRSTDPKQRCRVILASNPPRGGEGQWVIEWWAPWLDPAFPNPARSGELRWYIRLKNKSHWVEGPGEYQVEGETYTARSRTFIPAALDDNPYLARTDYRATLQSLPEPLRSQLLKGDFLAGREDDAWQVIPADWVQRARQRWTPLPPEGVKMASLGVDVAQGGRDRTVRAARYGRWFGMLRVSEGHETPDGVSVASLVFGEIRDGCTVVVDLGGGWGGEAYGHLTKHLPDGSVVGFMGVSDSTETTATGAERFANLRAQAWWRFREALDPQTGANVALPPDPELAAELTMPRRVPEKREILIESKEQIRKRLGRSTDKADAVVMAWAYGEAQGPMYAPPQRLQTTYGGGEHARVLGDSGLQTKYRGGGNRRRF